MEIISRKEAKEAGLKRYFTGKPCKYGHVSERYNPSGFCVECSSNHQKSNYMKSYQEGYREENKDKVESYNYEYYHANKEFLLKQKSLYYKENKNDLLSKMNEYNKRRYKEDAGYKTSRICKHMLKRVRETLNKEKCGRTNDILGYSNPEFCYSIESKFLRGMSWDNYGDWHIDHIYPVSRYVKEGVEDPSIINHLDNLIPMWAEHNLEKSDRTLEEYLEDRPELYDLYGHFLTQTS